jgi:DNA-nicking Smr family endonuclease
VRYGIGFNVSETPEYIEGTGYNVSPSIAKRLHRGDFSIQAHVDLHGLRVEDAKETFEEFLNRAVTTGKRGVLIVHGRGLSSPSEPILKNKVKEWLTRGPWRKWVVAYSSARRCDGGAGATYVLLRQRPVSKRSKIRRSGRGKP